MSENNPQNKQERIATKKKTATQLKNDIERMKKQQERELDKLTKQYQKELDKQKSQELRKTRNKKIYDWGGLVTTVFGNDEFDKMSENQDIKNIYIGLLVKMKSELSNTGLGIVDGKPTWCEYYKNVGREFMVKNKG